MEGLKRLSRLFSGNLPAMFIYCRKATAGQLLAFSLFFTMEKNCFVLVLCLFYDSKWINRDLFLLIGDFYIIVYRWKSAEQKSKEERNLDCFLFIHCSK